MNPPDYAKARAYWWWLEGNNSREGILYDLSEMKKVGIKGAIIFDAGSSNYNHIHKTESGPVFMSPQWRDLFKYSCQVADSLDIEISLNMGSGWNNGGPWITPELSSKKLVWSEIDVVGGQELKFMLDLPRGIFKRPDTDQLYYEPYAVLAMKINENIDPIAPLENFNIKAVHSIYGIPKIKGLGYDWNIFMKEESSSSDEYHTRLSDIIDISNKVDSSGMLSWQAPAGKFKIMRFVYTGTGIEVSTCSPGSGGLAMDFMSIEAMDVQFDNIVSVLLDDIKDKGKNALKYLHDDSWELGATNWTQSFADDFQQMNGYDITKYLPIIAGVIVENRDISNRFLYDFRRTIGDVIYKNHYQHFAARAAAHGLGIHSESGGPHPAPIDALKNLGLNEIPMGEFWIRANTHRVEDESRIFIKQAASAAHIYGKRFVQAEGPTSIGPMWEEDFRYMKPTFDRVFCEGLNRFVIHTFTHSPKEAGMPGNEYFAGTHFNPNVTWWEQSPAFLAWTARNSFMLSQGHFVGDVCYYYGDNTPNQVHLKHLDPSLGTGYDYDITNTEVILKRMSVKNGRIVLPDGMTYQALVLPNRIGIKTEVMEKLESLVKEGATLIGPKPMTTVGLRDFENGPKKISTLADKMWGIVDGKTVFENIYGKGQVVWGKPIREVLQNKGVYPDFIYQSKGDSAFIDYIHRTDRGAEIYYIANRLECSELIKASFRVTDMQPEIWNSVDGSHTAQVIFDSRDGRMEMPLYLEPFGSVFVVFRKPTDKSHYTEISKDGVSIFPKLSVEKMNKAPFTVCPDGAIIFAEAGNYELTDANGFKKTLSVEAPQQQLLRADAWVLSFDPQWGGPKSLHLDSLISWTAHSDPGVKYYSGTAVYENKLIISADCLREKCLTLNLGEVYNIAEVIINGVNTGVWWTYPFEKDVTAYFKEGENSLQIKIVNLWPNRIIGDHFLPEGQGFTKTNVHKFTKDYPLRTSGLLGPVVLNKYPIFRIQNTMNNE
ncbi:hypothetical protein AwDysgo_14620 [Bacteroidales bacterium]|nr:hypothetical protein AwDysgo_14620 [Bacteroidales bacterium]